MSRKKASVLFYPSVGPGYGMGNFLRCVTLCRLLRASAEICFLLPESFTADSYDWNSDFRRISRDKIRNVPDHFDVLIFDHQGPIDAGPTFRHFRTLWPDVSIIALDYFFIHDSNVEVFINLTDYRETEKPYTSQASYFSGLEYAIIRPEFYPFRMKTGTGDAVKKILITFGGEDMAGWTLKSIRWLEKNIRQKMRVIVIVGMLNITLEEIKRFVAGNVFHEYSVLKQVHNIEYYMSECDVAFCGGGTSILELSYLGKPVVALPQHEMERIFLRLFERNNFVLAGAEESLKEMAPVPCLRFFGDVNLRRNVSNIGKRLVDGQGVGRVARIILQMATEKKAEA
jgi:spore coat polysaccharide biosynthesis predicted glycosyltransferase SpsG